MTGAGMTRSWLIDFRKRSTYNFYNSWFQRKASLTIAELRQVYTSKRKAIIKRLAEFDEVGRSSSDEAIFEELVYCILTAGASAKMGLRSVEKIRPLIQAGTTEDLQQALRKTHRFPNTRAAAIYRTREYFRNYCGLRMRSLLFSFGSPEDRRDFLLPTRAYVALGIKKQATFCGTSDFEVTLYLINTSFSASANSR